VVQPVTGTSTAPKPLMGAGAEQGPPAWQDITINWVCFTFSEFFSVPTARAKERASHVLTVGDVNRHDDT